MSQDAPARSATARWRPALGRALVLARRRAGWLWPLLVVAVAAGLFFPGLDAAQLKKSDEALYAAAGLEMLDTGDVLYPDPERRFAAYNKMGKPPGAIWLVAASVGALGRSNLAARLPAALAGIAAVLLLYLIGARLAGHPAGGLVAAALTLAQTGWLELARALWLENLLTPLFLLALWLDSLARQETAPRRRLALQVGVGLCIGYAALTKHLVGLAPLGAIAAAELVLQPGLFLRPAALLRRFGVILATAAATFGVWLLPFLRELGTAAAARQIAYKLSADKDAPRRANDLWVALTRQVEPWVLVAGLACALALLLLAATRQRPFRAGGEGERAAYLAVSVAALLASHLLVFGSVSEKLRAWYFLPVVVHLPLFVGAALGAWLAATGPRLRLVAIATTTAGLAVACAGSLRWSTTFCLVAVVVTVAAALERAWSRSALATQKSRALGRWLRGGAAGTAVAWVLGLGLWGSAAVVTKPPPADAFQRVQARWRERPPPRLVVDEKHWTRPVYFTPLTYWYFSPVPIEPRNLQRCDLGDLPAGEQVLLHWTSFGCVKPRAGEVINLTQWWRLVRLR